LAQSVHSASTATFHLLSGSSCLIIIAILSRFRPRNRTPTPWAL